jgi:hypothetical protein
MAIAVASDMGITERCTVAAELLESLGTIPAAYLQALSAPVVGRHIFLLSHKLTDIQLQQLGDIGALLGSVVQSPLTVAGYLRIRQIL